MRSNRSVSDPNHGRAEACSPRPVLSASEIAEFVFCPQAWHISERGTPRTDRGERRLRAGTLTHQDIGRRTDRWLKGEHVRNALLMVIVVLIATLVVHVVTAGNVFLW
jgi:hypothetical protein